MFCRCPRPIPFNIYIDNLLDRRECTLRRVTSDEAGERELLVAWRVGLLFKGALTSRKSKPMGTSGSLEVSKGKSCTQERIFPCNSVSRALTVQGAVLQKKAHMLADNKLNMCQQGTLIAMKADYCCVLKRPQIADLRN